MTRPLPRRSTLLIALVIVVVDQLSKAAASSALREGNPLPLLPHLLSLQLVHNTGAAFSVLQGSTALLGLLSFCLLYTSPSPRDNTLSRMPSSA